MAHFARVNSDNIVIDVVVVHNDEMLDENGKLSRKAAYAQDPDGNWLEFVEIF